MKLRDAIQLTRANAGREGEPLRLHLACGFTPEPLLSFVCAEFSRRAPDRRIVCDVGPYGDIALALDAATTADADLIVAVLEWADLDPRLGYRRLGGWSHTIEADLLRSVQARLTAIEASLRRLADRPGRRLVLSTPSLPLPPAFLQLPGQAGHAEWALRAMVADFAARCASVGGLRVLNPDQVGSASPMDGRHDIRAELASDFPYSLHHAAAVAALLSQLALPEPPLKGLITDLDDTLWRGLLGEVGVEAVAWDLDGRAQMHGVYQQLLAALAEHGVLIALASKNEAVLVEQALQRRDLHLDAGAIFPVEAGWHPKSLSVERILKAWNVGPESVVFVDDSEIELAEVATRFPAMRRLRFATGDDAAVLALVRELRDLFAKEAVGTEDRLRRESLRAAVDAALEQQAAPSRDAFLSGLGSRLTLDFRPDADGGRALELLNKTNQFNLNGRRLDAAGWRSRLLQPGGFSLSISYRDKFGDLGRISTVLGRREGERAVVSHWVLSCRAFGRRIEHQTLKILFEELEAQRIELDFAVTERNSPVREFLREWGVDLSAGALLERDALERAPLLFHQVEVIR